MAKLRGRFAGSISSILIATLIVLSFSLITLAWYAKNLGERSLALQAIAADLGGEVIIESIAPKWFPVSVRESRFFLRAMELHLESFPSLSAALDAMLCIDESAERYYSIQVRGEPPPTDRRVIQGISKVPTLRALFLDSYGLSDDDLRELASLRKVEMLTISKTMCTNEGLKHLGDWRQLTILRCSCLPLDDKAVPHLQRLVLLKYLDISHTQISEVGILALAASTQLRELRIIGLDISPEVLERLHREFPRLKIERNNVFGHQDDWDWETNPVNPGIEVFPRLEPRVPPLRTLL